MQSNVLDLKSDSLATWRNRYDTKSNIFRRQGHVYSIYKDGYYLHELNFRHSLKLFEQSI